MMLLICILLVGKYDCIHCAQRGKIRNFDDRYKGPIYCTNIFECNHMWANTVRATTEGGYFSVFSKRRVNHAPMEKKQGMAGRESANAMALISAHESWISFLRQPNEPNNEIKKNCNEVGTLCKKSGTPPWNYPKQTIIWFAFSLKAKIATCTCAHNSARAFLLLSGWTMTSYQLVAWVVPLHLTFLCFTLREQSAANLAARCLN